MTLQTLMQDSGIIDRNVDLSVRYWMSQYQNIQSSRSLGDEVTLIDSLAEESMSYMTTKKPIM